MNGLATLVAISPQLSSFSQSLIERHRLGFEILHDQGNETAASYGLRFELPQSLIATYQNFGIDLPESNGDASWRLPLPARYIIDKSGRVRYARVNVDYRFRPEPTETLEALQRIVAGSRPSDA